ncbi:pyridoxamine 5'-phosphate oxidase family protein [Chloroflexota bacterium]
MRRNELEIKDRKAIESLIARAQICRIGLSENGIPYIVPMNFGYKDNSLYFHGALKGKKLEIITNNPAVCFEMDIDYELLKNGELPCRWGSRYQCIIGTGTATIIRDIKEKLTALNIIAGHYGGRWYGFSHKELRSVGIFKVEIENISGKQSGYLDTP